MHGRTLSLGRFAEKSIYHYSSFLLNTCILRIRVKILILCRQIQRYSYLMYLHKTNLFCFTAVFFQCVQKPHQREATRNYSRICAVHVCMCLCLCGWVDLNWLFPEWPTELIDRHNTKAAVMSSLSTLLRLKLTQTACLLWFALLCCGMNMSFAQ